MVPPAENVKCRCKIQHLKQGLSTSGPYEMACLSQQQIEHPRVVSVHIAPLRFLMNPVIDWYAGWIGAVRQRDDIDKFCDSVLLSITKS